jgi:phospholipid transport system substrate-binding protein
MTMIASNSRIGLVGKGVMCKALISIVCLFLCTPLSIAADNNPLSVVQTGSDQVFKIIRQYPQDMRLRRQKVKSVVEGYFDFEGMARLAVGRRWNSVLPAKQQEFAREFEKLLFNTYIGDIEKFAGQRVTYRTRSEYQDYVVVEARVNYQGSPVSLDYSLYQKNGNWKVYDIGVNGMSLAVNYRNQFNTVLANGSFDDLLWTLKQRIAQVCRTGSC